MSRVLLCGWFSVEGGEATAGDLLAADRVEDDLAAAGFTVDRATNAGFAHGVDWRVVDPAAYAGLVMVCGPLHGDRLAGLVDRFPDAVRVSVNMSVVDEDLAGRFDTVLPRDGRGGARPDLTFARVPTALPLIGVVRAHAQPEYADGRHERAHEALRLALADVACATVDFDTRVHPGADPFAAHGRSPAAVTTLAARCDAVVTTRLHGMVLSLAQGTPVLAVDPVPGGAKIRDQAGAIGWPVCFTVDDLEPEHLNESLLWCLSAEAADRARRVAADAAAVLCEVRAAVLAALPDP